MANEYYSPGSVTAHTLARAETVLAQLTAIETGLDKLPTEVEFKQNRIAYAVDSGAADAYVVSLPYAPASYVDGLTINVKFTNVNTGASTINVNSLGVKAIKRITGAALEAGDIPASGILQLTYDATAGYFVTGSIAGTAVQASASATAAADSATAAAASATAAAASAAAAATSAATLPDPSGNGDEIVKANAGGTAFETITAAALLTLLSSNLDDIDGLAVTDGNIIVGDGANFVAESGATARASLGAEAAQTAASQAEAEAGTETAIRSFSPLRVAQAIAALAGTPIPSTTVMLFYQETVPTGWTRVTTAGIDKHALVIDTQTALGSFTGTKGGSNDFATAFNGTVASGAHEGTTPSHVHQQTTHSGPGQTVAAAFRDTAESGGSNVYQDSNRSTDGNGTLSAINTQAGGGAGTHTHTIDVDVAYINVFLASKD